MRTWVGKELVMMGIVVKPLRLGGETLQPVTTLTLGHNVLSPPLTPNSTPESWENNRTGKCQFLKKDVRKPPV
jgi:hypothetical protein